MSDGSVGTAKAGRGRVVLRGRVLALTLTAAAVCGLGASPLPAATPADTQPIHLAYLTDLASAHPTVWVADGIGHGARRLGTGAWDTAMAPNGAAVAIITPLSQHGTSLVVVPTAGGAPRTLLHASESLGQVVFSPDSTLLAAVVDERRLVVITIATGAKRIVARGQIQGASFAPTSDRLVYGHAPSVAHPTPANLFVVDADGAHVHAITHDGRSLYPLWGAARIAFSHERLRRNDAPIFQLWLVRPDGHGVRHLTHLRIPTLLSGLTATAWSDDGTRLLAEYGGQDTSEAWTVDVASGRARDLTGRVDAVAGRALSHDGRTVLVQRGFFDDPAHQSVATIPFGGGHATVLVRHGGMPSWNR